MMKTINSTCLSLFLAAWFSSSAPTFAREHHVAMTGDDSGDGSAASPLRTIQAAARRAMPGDVVTVHEGTYRERIDPPRGGESDQKRIVYQAASGGKVTLKGSELVKGWDKVEHDTWKVVLPDGFFGGFNPYADLIRGDWFKGNGRQHHTGAVYLKGQWLIEAARLEDVMKPLAGESLWFAQVEAGNTTIWAQLPGVDPNADGIEIHVRKAVFYPSRTGRNFITVRGFTMEHAATNWAPPTAEQIGLVGTHWSKGWVIENNTIRYSTCTGVTLGKHGDKFDNTSSNSAAGYVETIKRGIAAGWSKENIGHHVVRNNHISHCEQAGIVGSLGAVFSTIAENEIHDIHIRQLFKGAEQAGIKIHAAIDTLIIRNHVYRSNRGIWLDWMAQGTRVTGNLLHDNAPSGDLFVEVNHGPFLVDHNILLSGRNLADWSQGGAYAHNLFAGSLDHRPELKRETPWLEEHGTKIAGLANIKGGDNRFFNNIFVAPAGLDAYDKSAQRNLMAGNVFLNGAKPSAQEHDPLIVPGLDPAIRLREENGVWLLHVNRAWQPSSTSQPVATALLGKTMVSMQDFVKPDGSPLVLEQDFFGAAHRKGTPAPGPFSTASDGNAEIKVWPPAP